MICSVSVLVLTLNEEVNLPRCLGSLNWCNDVVVLDSGSRDSTKQIALDWGARVIEHPFENYASQRNFGLKEIHYKNNWVLMVDADEEVPFELVEEISKATAKIGEETTLFRMRRKDHFLGKWIKRSSGYPTWFGRLVRPSEVRVEREINEEFVTDGHIELLQNHLDHYPFNKGFSAWLEKHNRYSTMEAKLMWEDELQEISVKNLLSKDPAYRRRGMKAMVYRMPFRPILIFGALYFVRGGFLDGRAGFIFCCLRAYYEFMINCKIREIKQRELNQPV